MKDEINRAIKVLAELVTAVTEPDDALKLTQAALNLAHVLSVQANTANSQK